MAEVQVWPCDSPAKRICEALGMDMKGLQSLTLRAGPGAVVTLQCVYARQVQESEFRILIAELQHYTLHPKPPQP